MTFQVSDFKGKQFLNFLDNELYSIKPSYTKGSLQLKHLSYSNSLCMRATRAITNHAPTGEYCLCFFPKEDFNCPCGSYLNKSRCHILHECRRFNNYWNPMKDTISQFVSFLEFNPNAFSFRESITQQSSFFACSIVFFNFLFPFFPVVSFSKKKDGWSF